MKNLKILIVLLFVVFLINCSKKKKFEKGFPVSPETQMIDENEKDGINKDSIKFYTRPTCVLLTGYPKYRLTTVYKLNFDKNGKNFTIGYNHFYGNNTEVTNKSGNQWHNNFIPGFHAVYGYNLINVSLYDVESKKQKSIFDKPVLIKTIYYPSFTSDTLNYKPVKRGFYLISVYDEDTNKDGFINQKDLRHIYSFDLDGLHKMELIPHNYSVISSEYDSANDYMYVFAQLDENNNGQRDDKESTHVFWIDLKNPTNNGRIY